MYALPDFNNFQTSNVRCMNGESNKPAAASIQYPPSSSSPFLTLGSGFFEKSGERKVSQEQNYRLHPSSNRKPSFFIRDPNKYKFSCDPCNRSFLFQHHLDKHIAQHVKCDFEGCSFQGHEKVVQLHWKMQHYSGLASLISKLNTPEEIKRWRGERRKNFPTAANIKKRQDEQAAKRARGEVLDKRHFGRRRRRQVRSHPNKDKPSFIRRRRQKRQKSRKAAQSSECTTGNAKFPPQKTNHSSGCNAKISAKQIPIIGVNEKLVKFPGTKFIEMNDETDCQGVRMKENDSNNFTDSDIECLGKSCVTNVEKPTFTISDSEVEDTYTAPVSQCSTDAHSVLPISVNERNNQMTSSVCEIVSSDECCKATDGNAASLSFFTADKEIEDSEEETPVVQKIVKSEPSSDPLFHAKLGGSLGSLMAAYDGESEYESKDEAVTKPIEVQPVKQKRDSNRNPPASVPYTKDNRNARLYVSHHKLTLLEKLLANEIRHERNVIFQCVTYIVKNNFFDKSD